MVSFLNDIVCSWGDCMSGKPALLRCARCKSVRYCGVDCQRHHWLAGHKKVCKDEEGEEEKKKKLKKRKEKEPKKIGTVEGKEKKVTPTDKPNPIKTTPISKLAKEEKEEEEEEEEEETVDPSILGPGQRYCVWAQPMPLLPTTTTTRSSSRSPTVPTTTSANATRERSRPNVLLLLHGAGDTSANFLGVGERLNLPWTHTSALVAPYTLPFGMEGGLWYPDFASDGSRLRPGTCGDVRLNGLVKDCRAGLHRFLRALLQTGLVASASHIFLLGFGQGGIAALDAALTYPGESCLGGVIALSSDLYLDEARPAINDSSSTHPNNLVANWIQQRGRTPIFIAHGHQSDVATSGALPWADKISTLRSWAATATAATAATASATGVLAASYSFSSDGKRGVECADDGEMVINANENVVDITHRSYDRPYGMLASPAEARDLHAWLARRLVAPRAGPGGSSRPAGAGVGGTTPQ